MNLASILVLVGLLLLLAVWFFKTVSNPGKTFIFILALLFTFGSGLCAFGSIILVKPIAILAAAALVMSVLASRAVWRWKHGLPVPVHPLLQVAAAVALTTAAYWVALTTIRLAG
jgi:hypothetical protein